MTRGTARGRPTKSSSSHIIASLLSIAVLTARADMVVVRYSSMVLHNSTSSGKLNMRNENQSHRRPEYAVSKRGSSYGREESIADRWSQSNLQHIQQLWRLTDEQYRQLSSMQDKLADIDHWKNNPYEVIRFVTGPQGYGQAETLFRAMIEWRIENNIDTILDTYKPPKLLLDYIPSAILQGYDKDGDPIYLERGGVIDGHGLLTRFGKEGLMKHVTWSRELASRGRWIEDYEKECGKPPTRLTIVYDLHGLNASHLKKGVLPFLVESLRLTQQRYNGLAKRMIIIRPPFIFNAVWNICKYAFPKAALKKMVFSGPNNHLEVLDKFIERTVLPPCILPGSVGKVARDMSARLEGGPIPNSDISIEDEKVPIPAAGTCVSEDESSTSYESWSNRSTGSKPNCSSMQMVSVNVQCRRLAAGFWVTEDPSNSNTIRVVS